LWVIKDKVKDEKTDLIYHISWKNCSSSYIEETVRKFGLRIEQHKKKSGLFHSWHRPDFIIIIIIIISITHKPENHVIDWDKPKMVDREAQRQTRWIKEPLWIRNTPMCMNRDAGSYQLYHTWDQVISRSRAPSSCK